MATIYKGEQISLARPVIIKKLHPHLAADKELVKRFEREAKILGKLSHKNIVEIIDFYKIKGDYFIVLEFVDGKSLKELVKEVGTLPLNIANFIVFEILSGLAVAHKQGILHRDIKPGNIMIGENGMVKISDFGLALSLEGAEITEPGATIGTPAYLPPELVRGEKASPKTDIYSLGLLYYEILTGTNPFEGKNRFETINNVLYKKLPTIQITNNDKDKVITRIITKMTKADLRGRYGNIDSILQDLSPHNTISQKNLALFISNPTIKEEMREVRKTSSRGSLVYALLLILVIFVAIAMMVEKERVEKFNSLNLPPVVHYQNNKDDTVNEKVDTATVLKNSIEIHAPKKNNNSNKKDTLRPPVINQDSYGFIKLLVKPWAKIFIDNVLYGNTPLSEPIRLTVGEHHLTFRHPNRKEFSENFTIAKDETLKISITLEATYGYLKISVSPWAEIYIDGEQRGVTPIAKPLYLTSGEHLLELKKGDSILWHEIINIPAEDTLKKTITLE